jgi:hypothetical protein
MRGARRAHTPARALLLAALLLAALAGSAAHNYAKVGRHTRRRQNGERSGLCVRRRRASRARFLAAAAAAARARRSATARAAAGSTNWCALARTLLRTHSGR